MGKVWYRLCAMAAATITLAPAQAACDQDTLATISEKGDVLIMQSGEVYQVQLGDEIDSQLWLPSEDVLICEGKIINEDENAEEVAAIRIK